MKDGIKNNSSVFIPLSQFTTLFLAMIFFCLGITYENLSYLLFACLAVLFNNILEGVKNVSKHILFLTFQATFFFFLLSRQFINYIDNGTFNLNFSYQIQKNTMVLLFLSLVFCFFGYKMHLITSSGTTMSSQQIIKRTINQKKETFFRQSSRLMFYLTLLPELAVIFEKAAAVLRFGYIGYYTDFTSTLPILIQKLAMANNYCMFAFCASLPTKQEVKRPFFFYFLVGVLSLLTGQRNNFILTISFILIYYCLRSQEKDEKWVGKHEIVFVCIAVPLVMFFIVWFGYVREKNSFEVTSLSKILYLLFNQQGVSATVIAYQQQFQSNPILKQNFTFGPLWTFMTQNVFAQVLFGIETYQQNTVAAALHAHSFGQSISFLALRDTFLNGKGLGSSYIAEVMQDYSFWGVVLINFIYGKFMHITKSFENRGFWMRLYVCYALKGIIYAPRDTALGPFMSFFTFDSLAALFLIWIGMIAIQQIQGKRTTGSIYIKDDKRSKEIPFNGAQKKSCYIK